ncbi:hypothetical protein BV22DRAFT_864026 [Leucogyrophana mollusca]|uniref:Uncharacterized protein n=1 Tax=Leucogyrophana mollusca TaxID=85980 RepID=A0ACB8B138_9AGAM|nr:hypothetical protein BV22DRAFT_864026 [Leucogyrophana mollusca]
MAVTYDYKVTTRDGLPVGCVQEFAGVLAIELAPERAMMFAVPPPRKFFGSASSGRREYPRLRCLLVQCLPAWVPGVAFKRKTALCQDLATEVESAPQFHGEKNRWNITLPFVNRMAFWLTLVLGFIPGRRYIRPLDGI